MIRSSPFPLGRVFLCTKFPVSPGQQSESLPYQSQKSCCLARGRFSGKTKKRPADFQQEFGGRFCLPVFTLRTMAGNRFPVALSPIFPQRHTKKHSVFSGSRQKEDLRMGAPQQTPLLFLPSEQAIFSGIQVRTALFGCKPSRQICCAQRYSSAFFRTEHTFFSIMPAAESITGFTLRAPCGHTETQRIQEIHAFASTCFGSA